jgi:predicted transcriptional regulator
MGGERMELREVYHLKRRKLGVTLQEIAAHLKVHHSSVSRHETGKINFNYAKEYMIYIDTKERELNK